MTRPAHDDFLLEEIRQRAERRLSDELPRHYRDAEVSERKVHDWVQRLIALALERHHPAVRRGPSLLVLGHVGTGKTFQAWGAIKALAQSGVVCRWQFTTAADMYAALRPRHKVDSEEVFARYADAPLLVLDDLGAANTSDWVEEINYRLINHRYQHELATMVTSNAAPSSLRNDLGERVTSRLTEMAERVVLSGQDRRRTGGGSS